MPKSYSVLYVEDDEYIAQEMVFFLQSRVKTLYTAYDGDEGLALFKKQSPDIVITDIKMPHRDGLSMAEAILEISPNTPIIVLSAFNDATYLFKAIELGVYKYLPKPSNLKNLLQTLEDIAVKKRLEEEVQRQKEALETFNIELQNRVKLEVEKNRKKDKILAFQAKNAQMGQMLNMIAHQWRQPLAAISSTNVALTLKVQLNKLDKETALDLCAKISDYTQHLSSTIDDFRTFFTTNKEKVNTDYTKILRSVLGIIGMSIRSKDITLIQDLKYEKTFKSFPNELKQVILNLIKNSEDILAEKGVENPYIKISTFEDDDSLILRVSDNGGGVPEDIIENIFDPYFSTKTKKDGTGLGLYMSKIIIEEHCGGKLNIHNDTNGAVFSIVFAKKEISSYT